VQILAFRVYRSSDGSGWIGISPDLPAEGGELTYVDQDVRPGVVYAYEFELLGPGGPAGRYGPVEYTLPGVEALWCKVSPQPGADEAAVTFGLPAPGDVLLRVFDPAGREVGGASWPGLARGTYTKTWQARDSAGRALRSGTYWLRLETPAGSRGVRWSLVRR
jgi:hypothetical protein